MKCLFLRLWPWQRRRQVRGWKAAFHAPPGTWCTLPCLAARRSAAPSPCWRGLVTTRRWWWHSPAWAGWQEFKKRFIYIQVWLCAAQTQQPYLNEMSWYCYPVGFRTLTFLLQSCKVTTFFFLMFADSLTLTVASRKKWFMYMWKNRSDSMIWNTLQVSDSAGPNTRLADTS